MKDAFGVERGDEVAKAFTLKPVGDFIKGATNALRGKAGPMASPAGAAGMAAPGKAMGAVKRAGTESKAFAMARPKTSLGIGAGAAAATGGGLGYAAGNRKQ